MTSLRIGHGYDVHRLVPERPLILGGVNVPFDLGLLGHSDADVLTHAIMDALLGAAALGDIGRHFPDCDEAYRGADSLKLASHVAKMLRDRSFAIVNVDATLIAQRPKIAPFIEEMQMNIANALGILPTQINLKATTEEHLGFTGEGLGMAAHAVCLIEAI